MMTKRMVFTALLILGLAVPAAAQDLTNKVELSVGGAFQAWTETYNGQSDAVHFFNIPIRVGYFVTRDFELEAEGIVSLYDRDWSGVDGGEWTVMASANGLYNFTIPNSPHIRPFVLAGIGISDSYTPPLAGTFPFGDISYGPGLGPGTRTVFNLGAGLKTMVGDHAAFRVEYRFQRFPEDEAESLSGWNAHSIQMGASLFL